MTANREAALARLSLSAAAIDLLVITLIVKAIHRLIPEIPVLYGEFLFWSAVPAAWIVHLFVVEILAGGWSIGRLCLGLQVADAVTGEPLGKLQRIGRFASILSTFGLRSLSARKLASHHTSSSVSYTSNLSGVLQVRGLGRQDRQSSKSATPKALVIKVLSGPHANQTVKLATGRTFSRDGYFNVGRDRTWADLVLDADDQVSGNHCRIRVQSGRIWVADWGSNGGGSTNGTYIGARRLKPVDFTQIDPGTHMRVGNTKFVLHNVR